MKTFGFSFKSEALWMLVFSIAPAILGLLILLFVIVVVEIQRSF